MSEQFQNLGKQKYHHVGTVPKSRKTKIPPVPKSNRKIVERGKIDSPNTQIHTIVHFFGLVKALQ
jgi:hypothetical protein